ncbi:GDSL esterase/lipase [Senna tora]|uniref:GDSL esterase/lipase n=1 Tax=Senna tora TaxID=362788 RepID=A0A834X4T4_9FABA|nr:GDSL esterase/lipase [Senna tora]
MTSSKVILLVFSFIAHQVLIANANGQPALVPALYVFGDSAIYLGLPMAPPYLNLSDHERSQITTGINYASGSSGILNITGDGERLPLKEQVKYFSLTATRDLPRAIKNKKELEDHLAKSIFLLLTGITHLKEHCYEKDKVPLCVDRSKYFLFDNWGHPTEIVYKITSMDCFNGTSCVPLSLLQLANK